MGQAFGGERVAPLRGGARASLLKADEVGRTPGYGLDLPGEEHRAPGNIPGEELDRHWSSLTSRLEGTAPSTLPYYCSQ